MHDQTSTLAFDAEFVEVGNNLLRNAALPLFLSLHHDGYHVCMVENDEGFYQLFRSSQKRSADLPC
ncbi:hypothetical protein LZ012_17315 [Dechloromonas sp. XY25]|uniref:Uncharacterized protein n=1 Tax=Dechloromonas hankyongensis TaxID=2908002 RepID=A0ABS9K6F2_9RHOO|nr:hypothetical protein [Dechloromonas hankyongensis]MCG2578760.1 hypothetical protein [Dechloromonas hankyongensis]